MGTSDVVFWLLLGLGAMVPATILLPFAIYQAVKLGRYGYLRGEELFRAGQAARLKGTRDAITRRGTSGAEERGRGAAGDGAQLR